MAVGVDDLALVVGRIVDELGHMAEGIGDLGPASGIVIGVTRNMAQRVNAGGHLPCLIIDGGIGRTIRISGQR